MIRQRYVDQQAVWYRARSHKAKFVQVLSFQVSAAFFSVPPTLPTSAIAYVPKYVPQLFQNMCFHDKLWNILVTYLGTSINIVCYLRLCVKHFINAWGMSESSFDNDVSVKLSRFVPQVPDYMYETY